MNDRWPNLLLNVKLRIAIHLRLYLTHPEAGVLYFLGAGLKSSSVGEPTQGEPETT